MAQTEADRSQIESLADHLFRRESGRMVAALTRIFGTHNLALAEDVVQEALLQALRHWPFSGIPKNPAGWLYQVARRKAIDVVRREHVFLRSPPWSGHAPTVTAEALAGALFVDEEIADDTLRMMFTCCHPALPLESQVALTLNLLCGFGSAEIARALLVGEAAIHKRLSRAKQRIRESPIAFEVPSGSDLAARVQAVLAVLYLMFNEGYSSSFTEHPIRKDVCVEAMRLCALLTEHPAGNHPDVFALMALMCFHAARLDARVDESGNLLMLNTQDRSRWNGDLIRQGVRYLDHCTTATERSPYLLEAAIAAAHCLAERYETTDWESIVRLYDQLMEIKPSPIVALNRAIALAEVDGPQEALRALEALPDRGPLETYHLYPAALGELHLRLGHAQEAERHFARAIALTASPAEKRFLQRKVDDCRKDVSSLP
ncbi:MAG: RNA polymerase sigma factor [bacterium]